MVVTWTFTGTHWGPLDDRDGGKGANGIAIYRIVDGKIAEGAMTWNKYDLLRQLGVVGRDATYASDFTLLSCGAERACPLATGDCKPAGLGT